MTERPVEQPAPPPATPGRQGEREQAEIDIEKLADRVYRLMRHELRLLHARGSDAPTLER